MLFRVNENVFVGLFIRLNQINLLKAGLFQAKDSPKCPHAKFQLFETSRNCCYFSI